MAVGVGVGDWVGVGVAVGVLVGVNVSVGVRDGVKVAVGVAVGGTGVLVAKAGGRGVFGQEVDLTANYRYNGALGFQAGASAFFPGSFTEAAVGDATTYWLYLQTTATF